MSAKPFDVTLNMAPKNIILGIGSRKNAEYSALRALLERSLSAEELHRVSGIATIDRKSNEPCILKLCEAFKIPLKTYTAEQLAAVPGKFTGSGFVEHTVGVDNVCERSAVLGSGENGKLISQKDAGNGITMALGIEPYTVRFFNENK